MTIFEGEGSLAGEVDSGLDQARVEKTLDTQALGFILTNACVPINSETIEALGIGE